MTTKHSNELLFFGSSSIAIMQWPFISSRRCQTIHRRLRAWRKPVAFCKAWLRFSVLSSFVQIWETATTRKYLCKWHRFCSIFDEQNTDRQTDVHTKHFLTAFHKISYCKIQTARWVNGGCDVSINGSRRWVKPNSVTHFSLLVP